MALNSIRYQITQVKNFHGLLQKESLIPWTPDWLGRAQKPKIKQTGKIKQIRYLNLAIVQKKWHQRHNLTSLFKNLKISNLHYQKKKKNDKVWQEKGLRNLAQCTSLFLAFHTKNVSRILSLLYSCFLHTHLLVTGSKTKEVLYVSNRIAFQ